MMRPPAMLRVAVTDRCNLRCAYCMPAEGITLATRSSMLSLEELAAIVVWIDERRPLKKIKITGGEPLVRQGLPFFIERLSSRLASGPEISMTSNAALLAPQAAALSEAGLERINVSLDTVDPQRYVELTRGGRLEYALEGLKEARKQGLFPIKLNSVLRKSSWRSDVPEMLDFAAENGYELRFLELMRTGTEFLWSIRELISATEVRDWLSTLKHCSFLNEEGPRNSRNQPARNEMMLWRGQRLEVGWILPRSRPFCSNCDRLRLDPRGRIRRCLMDPLTLDLGEMIEYDGSAVAEASLDRYLEQKRPPLSMDNDLPMAALGG